MMYRTPVLSLLALLFAMPLLAQRVPGSGQGRGRLSGQRGGTPDASQIIKRLDANGDHVIDRDEASKDTRGRLYETFDSIDFNSDGVLDETELNEAFKSRRSSQRPKPIAPKTVIKQVDDNGDGTLNALEVAAKDQKDLSANFSTIDTNQDGELDLEELTVYYASKAPKATKDRRRKRD